MAGGLCHDVGCQGAPTVLVVASDGSVLWGLFRLADVSIRQSGAEVKKRVPSLPRATVTPLHRQRQGPHNRSNEIGSRSRGTPEPTGDMDSVPAWMAAGLAMLRGAAASTLGSVLYGRIRTICTSLAPTASTSSIRLGFGRTFRAAGRPAPRLREKQHEERSSSIDPAPPWRAPVPSLPADIRPVGQCR
jgi:hypothetical protein